MNYGTYIPEVFSGILQEGWGRLNIFLWFYSPEVCLHNFQTKHL